MAQTRKITLKFDPAPFFTKKLTYYPDLDGVEYISKQYASPTALWTLNECISPASVDDYNDQFISRLPISNPQQKNLFRNSMLDYKLETARTVLSMLPYHPYVAIYPVLLFLDGFINCRYQPSTRFEVRYIPAEESPFYVGQETIPLPPPTMEKDKGKAIDYSLSSPRLFTEPVKMRDGKIMEAIEVGVDTSPRLEYSY